MKKERAQYMNEGELLLLLVPEYGWEDELDPEKAGTCTYT